VKDMLIYKLCVVDLVVVLRAQWFEFSVDSGGELLPECHPHFNNTNLFWFLSTDCVARLPSQNTGIALYSVNVCAHMRTCCWLILNTTRNREQTLQRTAWELGETPEGTAICLKEHSNTTLKLDEYSIKFH